MINKIIAYKAPIDLYNGAIPKGTLYKPIASNKNVVYAAVNSDNKPIDSGRTNLPKEIVEQWVPVYEKTFVEGDYVTSLLNIGNSRDAGEVFKVLKLTPSGDIYYREYIFGNQSGFRASTQDEIDKYEQDILIREAKKRYPVGTEFYSAFPCTEPNRCICNGGYEFSKAVGINRNVVWAYNNAGNKSGWLHCDGVWAKIIKEEVMDTEKKIIGYKLVKPEYEKIVVKSLGLSSVHTPNIIIAGMIGYYIPKIEELGIMDWFEPVYGEELKVGDIVKVISNIECSKISACNDSSFYKPGKIGKLTKSEGTYYANKNTNWWFMEGCPESAITCNQLVLATANEIKEYENNLLLEEAKKRYPVGCKVKLMSLNTGGDFNNEVRFSCYQFIGNQLYVDNNLLIYDNGKWVEIIPSHPKITINGYTGEFFDTHVKFGCAEISKQLFLELYAVKDSTWTNGREIESITIGKGTFSKAQIKEIAEYYLGNQ